MSGHFRGPVCDIDRLTIDGHVEFTTALINGEAEESGVQKNLKSRILAALSFGSPTRTTIRRQERTSSTATGTLSS